MLMDIITIGGADVANKLEMTGDRRSGQEGWVRDHSGQRNIGKSHVERRAPKDNAPVDGIVKVFGNILTMMVVELGGYDCKFGKGSDRITNVGARGHVGKQLFTKQ
jgi:hypothetical protein